MAVCIHGALRGNYRAPPRIIVVGGPYNNMKVQGPYYSKGAAELLLRPDRDTTCP
jgi:hypothetical protein